MDQHLLVEHPTRTDRIKPDIRVGVLLSPCFSLLPFASFIDCLRFAADDADHSRQIYCSWKIIAPEIAPVAASCGVEVTPEVVPPDPAEFDYLVVVGGLLPRCLDLPEETFAYIRSAYASNITIIGLCTGSFILAKAGLMGGRRCAVHSEHRTQMLALFPDVEPVTDQLFVNDCELITSPGGASAIDLACNLIETHCGKARAVQAVSSLLIDKARAAQHMPHRPYAHLSICGNWKVEKAVELMERHIGNPYRISKLAAQLGCSQRELNRSFASVSGETPSSVWRNLRLSHGKWLLLNTNRTITQIALECGFADAAHFTRWFKRAASEAPKVFRRRSRQTFQQN